MDDLTPEQRRKNMRAIKSKDTMIELMLRRALWREGIRYRKNYKSLPGKPDIAITKYQIAIFCDSDFWHGYEWEERNKRIKSNRDYWIPKIERNMERDRQVNAHLTNDGWIVLRFWEWEIKKQLDKCINEIMNTIENCRKKSRFSKNLHRMICKSNMYSTKNKNKKIKEDFLLQ